MKYTLTQTHTYRHGDYVASLIAEEQSLRGRSTYYFHIHHHTQAPNEHPTHYLTIDRFDRSVHRSDTIPTQSLPELYHLVPDLTVITIVEAHHGEGDSLTYPDLLHRHQVTWPDIASDPNRHADYQHEAHYCIDNVAMQIVYDLDRQAME